MTFAQWTGSIFRAALGVGAVCVAGLAIAPCAPVIFATAMLTGTVTVSEIGAVCMAIAGVGGAVAGAIASGDCALAEEQKQD